MAEFRVGISGWRYTPWRGSFYPKGLRQKDELWFASRAVNSIEINGSFYALQTPERYISWRNETPDDFIFSVKAPRFITHIRRLRDITTPMANFFASGVLQLGNKLGPILWQFPPNFKFAADQFEEFLTLLPTNTNAAYTLAQHSNLDSHRRDSEQPNKQPLRYAVEIRNNSFCTNQFIDLLAKFKVALVVADSAGRWPQLEDITSSFMYMRLHGDAELYKSGYSDQALARWHQRIKTWHEGQQVKDAKLIDEVRSIPSTKRDIYCYFDNTDKLWAPHDARKILTRLGLADQLETKAGILPDVLAKPQRRKRAPKG